MIFYVNPSIYMVLGWCIEMDLSALIDAFHLTTSETHHGQLARYLLLQTEWMGKWTEEKEKVQICN